VTRGVLGRPHDRQPVTTLDRKVGKVSRFAFYLRFAVLLAVLATAAVVLGGDPWGPW